MANGYWRVNLTGKDGGEEINDKRVNHIEEAKDGMLIKLCNRDKSIVTLYLVSKYVFSAAKWIERSE